MNTEIPSRLTNRLHLWTGLQWLLCLLAGNLVLAPAAFSQSAVTTLAGSVLTSGSTDGNTAVALFSDPTGLAMDGNGNIYVADNQNHTIRKLSPDGVVSTLAGRAGQAGSADGTGTNAFFNNPSGVALDNNGTLYITDTGNHTIRRIAPSGAVDTLAGKAGESGTTNATGNLARFNTPLGIAVDQSGVLYVADSANQLIRRITSAGAVSTLAGIPEVWGSADGPVNTATFNCPAGVAVDNNGNVYVSDSNNHAIRKITPAGAVTTWAGSVGVDGNVDATGQAARFGKPGELKIDKGNNLFVVDSFNHTIRKLTTNAVVTTIAGSAGNGGAANGLGDEARFLNPYGLAVDRNGNLRVSDTYNQTIRFLYAPIAASLTQPSANGSFVIAWQAVPGNQYQVQSRNAIGEAAWQNLGAVVTATTTTATQTDDSTPTVPQRFYRVLLLP
ncbi:MAG: hypothetical protein JWR19_3323 [Pedosphaera sp.]|nr:hypothetical protein [Pedosphaera sp.]